MEEYKDTTKVTRKTYEDLNEDYSYFAHGLYNLVQISN
jgi:hypothetical protein